MDVSMTRRMTLDTVAKQFGVSAVAISKALNDAPDISPELRRRVREFADEHGFRPRKIQAKTKNIAALSELWGKPTGIFSSYLDQVMTGMYSYLRENDLEFSFCCYNREDLRSADLVKLLCRNGVNGVVVLNSDENSTYLKQLDKQRFPYCTVMNGSGEYGPYSIDIDHEATAYEATRHLLDLGHRRICLVNSIAFHQVGKRREAGYRMALDAVGIAPEPRLIMGPATGPNSLTFGTYCVHRALAADTQVTAFLAVNFETAVGVLRGIQEKGLNCPEQISVLGFDDDPLAPYMTPPLTVMALPNRQVGYIAAQLVHQQMDGLVRNGFQMPERDTLGGAMISRLSTAPAPA